MLRQIQVALIFVGFVFYFPSTVLARTWNVIVDGSGDAPTVQAGIDSAAGGDTVLVYPGTYEESITFGGRNICLRSTAGPDQTILDGTGFGREVVTFSKGERRATILEGFTITHGKGGIFIANSEPSVVSNIITENAFPQDGGGIWCAANTDPITWSPLIKDNTITNNRSQNLAGGIGTLQEVVPEIIGNYIAENEARDGDGGGIYYRSFDDGAVIRGNTVVNNRAGDHGEGFMSETQIVLELCVSKFLGTL